MGDVFSVVRLRQGFERALREVYERGWVVSYMTVNDHQQRVKSQKRSSEVSARFKFVLYVIYNSLYRASPNVTYTTTVVV